MMRFLHLTRCSSYATHIIASSTTSSKRSDRFASRSPSSSPVDATSLCMRLLRFCIAVIIIPPPHSRGLPPSYLYHAYRSIIIFPNRNPPIQTQIPPPHPFPQSQSHNHTGKATSPYLPNYRPQSVEHPKTNPPLRITVVFRSQVGQYDDVSRWGQSEPCCERPVAGVLSAR